MRTLPLFALLSTGVAYADAPADPDEKVLSGPGCASFKAALQKAVTEAQSSAPKGTPPDQLMAAAMLKVKAAVAAAEYTTCSNALQHGLLTYRAKSIGVEAKMKLRQIADGITTHYADAKALCPSTKHPAPAKLELVASGAYSATAADWADPAWSCAGVDTSDLSKQRFQYEIKTTGKDRTEIVARGYPMAGTVTTMSRTGTVKGGTLAWSEIVEK